MHETAIATRIIREIRKKAKEKKIVSATVEVGELAEITAKELAQTLSTMADFKVIIKTVKAKVKCRCGFQGSPKVLVREHDFVLYECPRCTEVPKVIIGKEIVLRQVKTK